MSRDATRRWWALIAVAVTVLVVGLDLTVLNLALPTLAHDLHASNGDLQWFASAYSLVLAAALLPVGFLGDRFGRKRVLLAALAVFGGSSAACAYATSSGALIVARAFLGLGAAAILPLSLSILPVFFSEEERPKAIAIIMGATFIGYPVGPLLGGWLLDHFWWGSVFLINVPVVILAMTATALLMPESRASGSPRLDVAGALMSSMGLIGLTYGFIKAGQDGWSDTAALAASLAGAGVLAFFVLWERRLTRQQTTPPLVELALFRSSGFVWGSVLTTAVSFALFGILFAMPQYFQDVHGLDAFGSGLRLLPMVGGLVAGMLGGTRLQGSRSRPGGPRSSVVSPKSLITAGFAIMAVSLGAGTFTKVSSGTAVTAVWFTAVGLGLGLVLPAAMNAALSALTPERSGAGSALISAMRQVGATMGVAILGTVLNSAYRSHLSLPGLPSRAAGIAHTSLAGGVAVAHEVGSAVLLHEVRVAFVDALDVMLWVCAGIALASALLAAAFLSSRKRGAGKAETEMPASAQAIG